MTLISALLALAAGRGLSTASVGAAVLCGQLSVGWSNDYVDARLDADHRRADKPIPAGHIGRRTVGAAALLALAICVPLSLAAGTKAAAAHFVGLAAAYLYNGGLKRTPFSVVPYALAFGLLPSFITLGPPPDHAPAAWASLAAALAGAGAHFTQVIPDIARDRASGVLGLPQRVGERGSAVIGALLLAGAAGVVAAGAPSTPVVVAVAGTAVLMTGAIASAVAGRLKAAFRLAVASAGLVALAVVLGGRSF